MEMDLKNSLMGAGKSLLDSSELSPDIKAAAEKLMAAFSGENSMEAVQSALMDIAKDAATLENISAFIKSDAAKNFLGADKAAELSGYVETFKGLQQSTGLSGDDLAGMANLAGNFLKGFGNK